MLNRVFRNHKNGFYIDVGAMDPVDDSVTKWFYDQGWSGINIEPNPWFYEKLLAERPRDINLNLALGEREEERILYVFEQIGNSTFDPPSRDRTVGRGYEAIPKMVRVMTLDAVCQKYVTRTIDFLKVDCEGWEELVLKSADWDRFRPIVLIVEATEPNTTIPAWSGWEPWLMENARYDMVYFDGLNRYFLRRESAELRSHFEAPPNIFDAFTPFTTEAARQSSQVFERERDDLASQLTATAAELAAQAINHQKRIAEMEDQRAELLRIIETKTVEIESLTNELAHAQEQATKLDSKLWETRLWVGKLSQEVAAGRRR